jgi:uncharacterized low-complexity protein
MSQKSTKKPLAIALGAAFVTSLAATPVANAAENPFAMSELSSGYMVAEMAEGKCGEGKCGGEKTKAEGKCGEGKMDKEGKCGEGKMDKEGKCGEGKMDKEGKCGEGKCGGSK